MMKVGWVVVSQIGQVQQNPSVFASQIQPEIKTALCALPAVFHNFQQYKRDKFWEVVWAPFSSGPLDFEFWLLA